MKLRYAAVLAGLTLVSMSGAARAAILFDFENTSEGTYTSLTQTMGGLTIDLTRPNSDFTIVNLGSTGTDSGFGNRTISPTPDPFTNTPFIVNFSKKLSAFSFQSGDLGADSDVIRLALYSGLNGTGTLVGSDSVNYGTASIPSNVATLSYSGGTFMSAVVIGGSTAYPNSVFYDNFSATVSAVPLPSSAPLFGAALLALGAVGYGVRRKTVATAA